MRAKSLCHHSHDNVNFGVNIFIAFNPRAWITNSIIYRFNEINYIADRCRIECVYRQVIVNIGIASPQLTNASSKPTK